MKRSRSFYLRLLAACVICLCGAILLISFSNTYKLPGWSEIFSAVSGEKIVQTDEDFVRFIDVGQGDCILISSNGYNALIDFGNQSDFGSELLSDLQSYGIKRLDCVMLSHFDADHVGGASKVIGAIETKYAVLPEQDDRSESSYDNFTYALKESKTEVYPAKLGTVINIGDFEITVLAYNRDAKNSNDKSVVLMAKIGNIKFLFTGDAGTEVEKQILSDKINVDCDVYKAAHHGSRSSNSKEFILSASPEYAVFSVGANNSYGHPHSEVTDILTDAGAKIYRTDRMGDITFKVENGKITVETEF
ncbi:MAG: MBL fold metallo-hydrolase [Clostridia bacterium]|nr:MBL fold metallo-hydrolase [Clostridia bacterium]